MLENALTTAFADAIVEGKKLSDVLKQLEKDMAEIALKRFVADPLVDAAGSLFGSVLNGLFGGARADGGPVSAGRAYLVGEKGPELFMPPGGGEIVPNNQIGGGTINIYQTISVAPDVSVVARAEIMRQLPLIRNYAAQGITDARLRGALPA
jgi:phage-related minor tail protein